MNDSAIVIGIHNRKDIVVPSKKVGLCILCDEPVYLSTRGLDHELEIIEYRKLKKKKLIGKECAIEFYTQMGKMIAAIRKQAFGEFAKKKARVLKQEPN